MLQCSRCGREINFGTYCDSCQFYVYNEQCWRCRMYLPKAELQQWCGQTYCPYCIQDLRDHERNMQANQDERVRKIPGEKPPDEHGFRIGQKNLDYFCDQCQSDLDIVYVIADHKFCELCFQQYRKECINNDIDTPPHVKFRIKESPGLLVRLINFLKRKINDEWKKRNTKKNDK